MTLRQDGEDRNFSTLSRDREPKQQRSEERRESMTRFQRGDDGRFTSTHGVFSKAMKEKYLDPLTPEGKEIADTMKDLAGEVKELSLLQKILLVRIKANLIACMQIESFMMDQTSIIDEKGNLLPVLSNDYLRFSEKLRKDLLTFQGLKSAKKDSKPLSLKEYLASKEKEETVDKG
jgi:hypothetical protein